MFRNVTPESVGVDSKNLFKLIKRLNNLHMHSFLVAKGNDIFCECYWKPFDKDFNHRMYSVTKSFMSIALGLCVDDGLIDLDKPVYEYFPDKINIELSEYTKKMTIREMLTMTTASFHHSWFGERAYDRTSFYLNDTNPKRPSGTMWEYDSSGSQVLSSLVERVTGKKLFDILNERIFSKLGTFKNATILKTPNGDSWGDSALICTPRDLLSFTRFVQNNGVYNGERLISQEYLEKATARQKDNSVSSHRDSLHRGYGYQIWRAPNDGFAFVGMGDQLAICIPSKDLIFICTGDNQGCNFSRELIVNGFYEYVVDEISDTPLPENEKSLAQLNSLCDSLELFCEYGFVDSPYRNIVNGVNYECEENPMGIKYFRFDFANEKEGTLTYENKNGTMVLPFKVNGNYFGKFPELGYSNDYGCVRTNDGFKYDCATSLAWRQTDKITVFSQIIDRYFGNVSFSFCFKDNLAYVHCEKFAEDFLWEYDGEAIAKQSQL